MGNPIDASDKQDLQQRLVDVSDQIVFAIYFLALGLLMFSPFLLAGETLGWGWYMASALALLLSLVSAIQLWRLWGRKKELLRLGVKEPDFGKPPELEAIERMVHPGGE